MMIFKKNTSLVIFDDSKNIAGDHSLRITDLEYILFYLIFKFYYLIPTV
jgi:hypothetical protein